jgi:hypothetical protein
MEEPAAAAVEIGLVHRVGVRGGLGEHRGARPPGWRAHDDGEQHHDRRTAHRDSGLAFPLVDAENGRSPTPFSVGVRRKSTRTKSTRTTEVACGWQRSDNR